MPCWVSPAIAAEFWNCSVDQVVAGINDGSITVHREGHLLLVQMALPGIEPEKVQQPIVTPQEQAALVMDEPIAAEIEEPMTPAEDYELPDTAEEQSDSIDLIQRRQIRRQTGQMRLPPGNATVKAA